MTDRDLHHQIRLLRSVLFTIQAQVMRWSGAGSRWSRMIASVLEATEPKRGR